MFYRARVQMLYDAYVFNNLEPFVSQKLNCRHSICRIAILLASLITMNNKKNLLKDLGFLKEFNTSHFLNVNISSH